MTPEGPRTRHGPHADIGSTLPRALRPLEALYAGGLAAKNAAYDNHWLPIRQLEAPVVSIGNLSVGGAGKTPLVMHLAELLGARGFAVDVLSRGYGRRSKATERVDPGLAEPDAARRYGDEPLLMARHSGVPVYVSPKRYAAGLLAEQQQVVSARIHLLDDGFQHRQLARAVDIVLLRREDFTAALLPAGRMREPLSALGRASIVVLRAEDAVYAAEVRRHLPPDRPIWSISRSVDLPEQARAGEVVAFCGIAHPLNFFGSLESAGATLAAAEAFPDHHAYTEQDIAALASRVRETKATTLLTTEKDLVRLSAGQIERLREAASLIAVPLRVCLTDEEGCMDSLLSLPGMPLSPAPV